ncbi:MAG: orotate phosphoribosyltransferase [Mariprofundaceae bacterium]
MVIMRKQEILNHYENAGALLHGHFVLSSGRHSARYLQSAKVLMFPKLAGELAGQLARLAQYPELDFVASPALGGLIIGHEVAKALDKPFIFTERQQGVMCLRRGFSLPDGARVLVVEDVVTTGGSVCECIEVLRTHGGDPTQVLALVDRAPGVTDRFDLPFSSLVQLEVPTFAPDDCPLCAAGDLPAVKPGSRSGSA